MKTQLVFAAILALLISPHSLLAETPIKEAPLEVEDVLSFLEVRHQTFILTNPSTTTQLSYCFKIYEKGKVVAQSGFARFETGEATARKLRYSILFKDEGDKISIWVRHQDSSGGFTVDKPQGAYFPFSSGEPRIDDKGRVVLAVDLAPGDKAVNDEDTRPDTAYRALVLEIERK